MTAWWPLHRAPATGMRRAAAGSREMKPMRRQVQPALRRSAAILRACWEKDHCCRRAQRRCRCVRAHERSGMTFRLELVPLFFAVALAAFACRAGGFWLMRFVNVTPRVQAARKAAPLAVMLGIVIPAAAARRHPGVAWPCRDDPGDARRAQGSGRGAGRRRDRRGLQDGVKIPCLLPSCRSEERSDEESRTATQRMSACIPAVLTLDDS